MEFKSINPYNGKVVGVYKTNTNEEIENILNLSANTFTQWSKVPIAERCRLIASAGNVLRINIETYANMMVEEMGKPISEARAELEKCAWVCQYYAENSTSFLANELVKTDAQQSFVRHDALGCILAVMPWNFPFWQVFRFAAPTLTAGNTGVLKHAANVIGCAKMIEEIFEKAGYPKGVFQNIIASHEQTEMIIAHHAVKAVTLTGSERAGAAVASLAGKYLKKSVLELGGNNAFIVWKDADIDKAVQTALLARMRNCGQSCIAAKRFILVEDIYDEFVAKFIKGVQAITQGDPTKDTTQMGSMARKDLAEALQKQVLDSISMGAELLLGGKQKEAFHEPTILGNVRPGMPAFDEETFGPLAAMIKVKDEDEAFALSERSSFGLGTTVFTQNIEKAISMANRVSDGAYFVNELVRSDPRLPFGGTKKSGYGRELAKDGMMEFVNRKTVYVK